MDDLHWGPLNAIASVMNGRCCFPQIAVLAGNDERREPVPAGPTESWLGSVKEPMEFLKAGDNNLETGSQAAEDRVDVVLAHALKGMSIHDRDKAYHEMHGVDEVVQETPEMISNKLHEFDEELRKLLLRESSKRTHAYRLALSQSSSYVENPEFRLAFLRADRFVAANAAERYLRFYDLKLHIFDESKLSEDVLLKDFSRKDIQILKAGHVQRYPLRDRAGRSVAVLNPDHVGYEDYKSFVSVQIVPSDHFASIIAAVLTPWMYARPC